MSGDFQLELARHIDRVRRQTTPCREGVITREVQGGWLSARPGFPVGPYPSASIFRIYWLTQRDVLTSEQIEKAARVCRELGFTRMFVWLAPWAWNDSIEFRLNECGATRVPWVEYIAFARQSGAVELAKPTEFSVRRLESDEAESVLPNLLSWYGADSVSNALRMMHAGVEEVFGAFRGNQPVGIGLLMTENVGEGWGYLGAAATDPAFRSRGAQGALIAARVARVAELGARWCTVETNTVVDISLRNLERYGFQRRIYWRVYEWNIAAD